MKVKLFTVVEPDGRALFLAKALEAVSDIGGKACLDCSRALFNLHHPEDNPIVIQVVRAETLDELMRICAEVSVEVEVTDCC